MFAQSFSVFNRRLFFYLRAALYMLLLAFFSAPSYAEILCTINAENYPGFKEGLIKSTSFQLSVDQPSKTSSLQVYSNDHFAFYLAPGRSVTVNGESKFMDFYTEIHQKNGNSIFRARSGELGGNDVARAELIVHQGGKNKSQKGLLIFSCKRYFE